MPDSTHSSKGIKAPHAHRLHHARAVHWLARLGPLGLLAVAAADATPLPLPIPASTDLLLLWLISRGANPYLLVPASVVGSMAGGYITWHLGMKGGRAVLNRHLPSRLREPLSRWVKHHPMLALCVPPILPPPLPLMPFVLAVGAFGISCQRFLCGFGLARTLRYSLVAWMGILYGRPLFRWCAHTLHAWSSLLR